MTAADTIMGDSETAPTSGRAAMTTPIDPNVHLLHEVRERLAAQGHAPTDEYEVIILRNRDRRRVMSLMLLPVTVAQTSALPARQATASFVPTESEAKLIRFLGLGDKLGKQCTEHMGHFYGRRGVKQRLVDCGIIEQRADGRWGLTDAGEEAFADLGD